MSLVLSSPVSHRHLPDPDLQDAKNFKLNVIEYIKKGSIELNRAPSDPEFVPYAQERDYIGNLITRRSTGASPSPVLGASTARLRTKPSSIVSIDGMSPSVLTSELSFNTFKFQPKTNTSSASKIPIKKLLQPLDLNRMSKKGSSSCFRTSGRDSPIRSQPKLQDFPSVGHYEVLDKLVHTPQQVSFNRDIRLRKPRTIQRCSSQEIDVIGAYNKVYLRKPSVPEFSKHTDRASHYYTNVESGLAIVKEQKKVLNFEKYEEPLPKKNPLDYILKDSVVEIQPRWKRGFELDPKNMPIDLPRMQHKFIEMKKKYQVFKAKLS